MEEPQLQNGAVKEKKLTESQSIPFLTKSPPCPRIHRQPGEGAGPRSSPAGGRAEGRLRYGTAQREMVASGPSLNGAPGHGL